MSDKEMTVLCAEAMGLPVDELMKEWPYNRPFDPLNLDSQAMALVKKFHIEIKHDVLWEVFNPNHGSYGYGAGSAANEDLNRAIVECVARMQKGHLKEKQHG